MVAILDNLWALVSQPFKTSGSDVAVAGTGFLIIVIILLCVVTPIVGVISSAVSTHTFDDGTGGASSGGCGGGSAAPSMMPAGYQYNPSVNPSGSPALLPALTAATVGDFQGGLAGFAGTRNMKNRAYGLTTAGTSSFSSGKLVGLAALNQGNA
jgi:hypothetical protein